MRTFILFAMSLVFGFAKAQTNISRTFPVKGSQNVELKFDYPEVKISTWNKNEIQITGIVNINDNENNDAFKIVETKNGNTITIEGLIPEIKNIPNRITVHNGNEKLTFKSKEEYEQYCKTNKVSFNTISNGVNVDIRLEIKIPESLKTRIESTYGLVEIKDFRGEIVASSVYGGIDATVLEKNVGKLSAETYYGQIYTNLDAKLKGEDFDDFHTAVTATPGNGPQFHLESKYGNIYLRK